MTFSLHTDLARDCITIGDFPVSRLLLMNNRLFPWVIMAPRRDALRELFDLSASDYPVVMEEIRQLARGFAQLTGADKMNVAALGNMVPQLHIHVIARFTGDAAWPNPVWNSGVKPEVYAEDPLNEMRAKLKEYFAAQFDII